MIQGILRATFLGVFITGCASMNATPDTRSVEQKNADFAFAVSELSGEYEVVEGRNEIFLHHNFSTARFGKVSVSRGFVIFKLIDKNNSELAIAGSDCGGSNHKLSTNIFCSKASAGISYISFGLEKHGYQVTSGAILGGFSPLNVNSGDFLLGFSEAGSGRPHYYTLRKLANRDTARQ